MLNRNPGAALLHLRTGIQIVTVDDPRFDRGAPPGPPPYFAPCPRFGTPGPTAGLDFPRGRTDERKRKLATAIATGTEVARRKSDQKSIPSREAAACARRSPRPEHASRSPRPDASIYRDRRVRHCARAAPSCSVRIPIWRCGSCPRRRPCGHEPAVCHPDRTVARCARRDGDLAAEDCELLGRARSSCAGYRNDPARTAEAIYADAGCTPATFSTIDEDAMAHRSIAKRSPLNAAGKNTVAGEHRGSVKVACLGAGASRS